MPKKSETKVLIDETLDYANMNAEQRIAYLGEEKKKREAAKALKLKNAKKTGFRAGMRNLFGKDTPPPSSSQSSSRATSSTVTRKVVTTKPATTTTTETVVQQAKPTQISETTQVQEQVVTPTKSATPQSATPQSRPTPVLKPQLSQQGTKKWTVDTSYVSAATKDVEVLRKEKFGTQEVEYADPDEYECTAHHIVYENDPLIDPKRKEEYLGDQEFELIFGKDKDRFYSMPLWKQQNEKAKQGWQ